MPHAILMNYSLKKKNKRIVVRCYRGLEDHNDFVFTVETKTLKDFRTRDIKKLNVVYGLETFVALAEVFSDLYQEPIFRKLANVAINRVIKDTFRAAKYVNDKINSEQNPEGSVATPDPSSNED